MKREIRGRRLIVTGENSRERARLQESEPVAKHVLVGGTWVPTPGETVGRSERLLPGPVREQLVEAVRAGKLSEPPEVKSRKFQIKDSHAPTEKWTKEVWEGTVAPLMKAAGASDEDVKWAEEGVWTLYLSTDRADAWKLQIGQQLADGADKKDIVDRMVRSKYERYTAGTDGQRVKTAAAFLARMDAGNPKPEGPETPKPWSIEDIPGESMDARWKRRDAAETQYGREEMEWRAKVAPEFARKFGVASVYDDPAKHPSVPAGGWWNRENAEYRERVRQAWNALTTTEDEWSRWRIINKETAEVEKLANEAAEPGKRAAMQVMRELSQEAFKKDYPDGVTVYRGLRDEDATQMPFLFGPSKHVIAGPVEMAVDALKSAEAIRVKVDPWTSWSPVEGAARKFMQVVHEGRSYNKAVAMSMMLRKKVTADDVQLYWKVGYAHNPSIDTFEVQIRHPGKELEVRREDVHRVGGYGVDEPEWVSRPSSRAKKVVSKAKSERVALYLSARPREWCFAPGEDEYVPPPVIGDRAEDERAETARKEKP